MARVVSPQERKVMDSVKKETCELCGSAKGCEVHHIIPAVLGGSTTADNLITVCSVCHAKLTPRNELIKIGIRKAKLKNIPLIFYPHPCADNARGSAHADNSGAHEAGGSVQRAAAQ